VSAELVREQIEVLLHGFPVAAIKTGMLYSREIVEEVARSIRGHRETTKALVPLVIDPVMVATSGDALLRDDALESYERDLFPLAALITPNMSEAARLSSEPIADLPAMRKTGGRLAEKYGVPVLLKGGHLAGDLAIDLLFIGGNVIEFAAAFSRGVTTHGTGCTYSAAIAAGLANRLPLEESVRRAKEFVTATIAQHHAWKTPEGSALHALNHSPPS
jgi:hydroxymethylpyrimidine/phosphomethylpyrimidine kinase